MKNSKEREEDIKRPEKEAMGLSDCLRHRQKKKREEVKLLQSITLERQAVKSREQ